MFILLLVGEELSVGPISAVYFHRYCAKQNRFLLPDFVFNGIFVYVMRICCGTKFIVIDGNFHVFFEISGCKNLDDFGHVYSLAIGNYAKFYILDVVAGTHCNHRHALWRGLSFVTVWSISWFRFSKLRLFGSVSLWCGGK